MNIQSYKGRHAQIGQVVEVYRNLHNGMLSIRDAKTKHVLGHTSAVCLTDVTFKVSQKVRERVVLRKRKEVHAVVRGTLQGIPEGMWVKDYVTYNPYKYETFVTVFDKCPIYEADEVVISENGSKMFITATQ